jgi:hypothetical protein
MISGLLSVPPVPSSELDFCDFIVIEYKVNLEVSAARSVDLDVDTTVIIGDVPLRSEWISLAVPMLSVPPVHQGETSPASMPPVSAMPDQVPHYLSQLPPPYAPLPQTDSNFGANSNASTSSAFFQVEAMIRQTLSG